MIKGDRVQINAYGKRQGIFARSNPHRLGRVVGESRGGLCVKVCWDGNKTASDISVKFLEIAPAACPGSGEGI